MRPIINRLLLNVYYWWIYRIYEIMKLYFFHLETFESSNLLINHLITLILILNNIFLIYHGLFGPLSWLIAGCFSGQTEPPPTMATFSGQHLFWAALLHSHSLLTLTGCLTFWHVCVLRAAELSWLCVCGCTMSWKGWQLYLYLCILGFITPYIEIDSLLRWFASPQGDRPQQRNDWMSIQT